MDLLLSEVDTVLALARVYQNALVGAACFVGSLLLFGWLRHRRLMREGKAREYAATHCAHGVNKFTRSCRKCAREFEQECRRGGPAPIGDFDKVITAVERARKLADKSGTHVVEVTVRFKGHDGTVFARKITLGANETVNA